MRSSAGSTIGGDIGLFLARLIVGGLFVVTGLAKIEAPIDAFSKAILAYEIIPGNWAGLVGLVSIFLPWIELVAGLCCLLGIWGRGGALLITGSLLVFTKARTQATLRGLAVGGCNCFPEWLRVLDFPYWYGVGFNLFLFAFALLLLVCDMGAVRLDRLFRRRR